MWASALLTPLNESHIISLPIPQPTAGLPAHHILTPRRRSLSDIEKATGCLHPPRHARRASVAFVFRISSVFLFYSFFAVQATSNGRSIVGFDTRRVWSLILVACMQVSSGMVGSAWIYIYTRFVFLFGRIRTG
ncbi:hypothetical protein M011DRAFT_143367 [Sporormia fimetaria CBS 119925]|uniref:Uncharacterized protein n=1 Tax=Sporormia fimetaria CBS 119925 TaxID=1340428 RepID=A0A6A6V3X3_9PLEO|nr:hypothetical protein M011DRAFT_143367 [Sporormia fimetaria CBS 119925]